MKIQILDEAQDDLIEGARFYEEQGGGLGAYFLDCLYSDIDSLLIYAGVHQIELGYHRYLSKRFPYAVFYDVQGDLVRVVAVLDCRRSPEWIKERLGRNG